MALTVGNPFNAFLQGRQARMQEQQDEQKNALLQMQLQNAPQEMAQRNRLLDLEAKNYEGQIDERNRKSTAETTALGEQKKQAAYGKIAGLSREALASGNPRAFVAAALSNPAYAQVYADAGIDLANVDLNSPDLERNLQVAASYGDQVSADTRYRAEQDALARKDQAAENAKNRAAQIQAAQQRQGAPPSGYQYNPDGTLAPIKGGPADPAAGGNKTRITEGERAAANYLLRMNKAEPLIGNYKPSVADQVAFSRAVNSDSELLAALGNSALSPEAQSYYQAASDWVRAKLRKESGAVISADEMLKEIKTYFPMPGESDKVIEQKRQSRLTAQEGMRGMSGAAAPKEPEGQGGAPPNNRPPLSSFRK